MTQYKSNDGRSVRTPAQKSAAAILEQFAGKPTAIAPPVLYMIRTCLDDGAIRYYNVIESKCEHGIMHRIPKLDTDWHPFTDEAEAYRTLVYLQQIDQLGGVRLFKRGRVVPIFSYPQYN